MEQGANMPPLLDILREAENMSIVNCRFLHIRLQCKRFGLLTNLPLAAILVDVGDPRGEVAGRNTDG
jgi:hypothetical protein